MPYQGNTSPSPSSPSATAAGTIKVIPAVDLFLGTVTILSRNATVSFQHPEPHSIARALAQAVRPTQWCAASRTLTVTVAAVGRPGGLPRVFLFQRQDRHPG